MCIEKSYKWIIERLNGEDGLGGIFPAMVNSLIAMKIDKKSRFDREILIAKKAINNLVVEKGIQPTVNLASHPYGILDGWVMC